MKILEFNFASEASLAEKVRKANKQLDRKHLPHVQVISTKENVNKTINEFGGTTIEITIDAEIAIPFPEVKMADTSVVGRIIHMEGGNMITNFDGINLDQFAEAELVCDHCNKRRNRTSTWIVQTSNGLIQVGDNCVDLYFGVDILKLLEMGSYLTNLFESEDYGGGRVRSFKTECVLIGSFLAATHGYKSAKAAEASMTSTTKDDIYFLINPVPTNASKSVHEEWRTTWAEFRSWRDKHFPNNDIYDQFINFWMEQEPQNEFERNCKVVALSPEMRFMGIRAYACKMWVETIFKPVVDDRVPSEWVGQVGEKLEVEVQIEAIHEYDGEWGTSYIVKMDSNGNKLCWKASSNPHLCIGDRVKVKGSVKKLNMFKNVKETVLTRCKIKEI